MTDPPSLGSRRGPRCASVAVRVCLVGLLFLALAAALSGCGASSALGSAVLAPLSVLSQTDVILETNLQSALTSGVTNPGNNGGGFITSGPPTSVGVVSVAGGTGVTVYTAFNPVDRHCLGTFVLTPGSPFPVLGESTPGTYDFWFGPTTAVDCTASGFTSEATVPAGWAEGDPASATTGWPGP
ncbi:MAG: hypothetical protein WAV54_18015 [Acidimicrobiales bacterium]